MSESLMRKLIREVLSEAFEVGTIANFQGMSTGSGDDSEVGDVIGSNKIESLSPSAQGVFRKFISAANDEGYTIKITSARRVPSHQWKLKYTDSGALTPAEPCRSDHQYGYALDINASIEDSGETKEINSESPDSDWQPIVDIAKEQGLKWQGSNDRVHFYMSKTLPKDECEGFYTELLDTDDKEDWDPERMIELEQDGTKNTAGKTIADILDIEDISIFASKPRVA